MAEAVADQHPVVEAGADAQSAAACCPPCAKGQPWACWKVSDGPLAYEEEWPDGVPPLSESAWWWHLDGDDDEERAAWGYGAGWQEGRPHAATVVEQAWTPSAWAVALDVEDAQARCRDR